MPKATLIAPSLTSNKTQALLAYLVTEAAFAEQSRPPAHQRDHLMALLWPRTPQQSLRQTLYQLRQAIPEIAGPDNGQEPFILSDRQTVQINPNARYGLDVARFLRLLEGEPSPDELAEAVSLYRGPFLADFHLPDSETLLQGERPMEAIAVLELVRAYYQEAQDPFYRALALWRLKLAHGRARRHKEERNFARRGLALAQEIGDRFVAAALLHNLGVGSSETAARRSYFEEAARLRREIGAEAHYTHTLVHLGADSVWREGDLLRPGLEIDPLLTRTRAELRETLGEETFAAAWDRGKKLDHKAVATEVLEWLQSLETAA